MIPYGCQSIDQEDIQAVVSVLESNYLTQGPLVTKFEDRLKEYCGVDYAVAVNSATSALHIACLALGVGKGDLVWTSPITFVASANCALYCGASVDFIDIELSTGNISIAALEKKLAHAQANNCLPKVIIPVHFAGQPCDMQAIHQLSKQYGFSIIEDAAHAIGSSYQAYKTGCGKYSDITVFSFHPVKIITSAEGGMALTNQKELADKMRLFSSHGVTRNPDILTGEINGSWAYEQHVLGFNYRISDIHAALGLSQVDKLDEFVAKRNRLSQRYDQAFKALPCTPLITKPGSLNSYHLYVILLDESYDRESVFDELRKNDLGVNVHYIPVYKQPYYQSLGFDNHYCDEAESFYKRIITLPLFPGLTEKDQKRVVEIVKEVLGSLRS